MGWGPVDWVGRLLPEAKFKIKCTSFFEFFGFERPLLRYLLKTVLHCKGSGIWVDAITQVASRYSGSQLGWRQRRCTGCNCCHSPPGGHSGRGSHHTRALPQLCLPEESERLCRGLQKAGYCFFAHCGGVPRGVACAGRR